MLTERIRTLLAAHREGSCLPPEHLARLYHGRMIDQVPFEHVLCCERCLERINEILGIPSLNERHPFDAVTRHRGADRATASSGGDPDDDHEPPSDEGEGPPMESSPEEEEETPPSETQVSFQRVHQALTRAYQAQPERLVVCVNGRPCAEFSVEQAHQMSTLPSGEEIDFIEVLSEDGLRLAYMEVDQQRLEAAPQQGRVALGGNRHIELHVSHETGQTTIRVHYHDPSAEEAEAPRKEPGWWAWLAALLAGKHGLETGWRVPVLATITVVLLLGGLSILISSFIKTRADLRALGNEREQMRQQIERLTKDLEQAKQQPASMGTPSQRELTPRKSVPESPVAQFPEIAQLEPTRGHKSKSAVAPLLGVKRIYVAPLGGDAFSQQVRDQLINGLRASGRFIVTDNQKEADAALKGSAKSGSAQLDPTSRQQIQVGEISLQLVNATGEILWTARHRGAAADVTARSMNGLLGELRRQERSR